VPLPTNLKSRLGLADKSWRLLDQARAITRDVREQIAHAADANFLKVLAAFQDCQISEAVLAGSTGYGYDDGGRESVDRLFANVFGCESAAVRLQWVSGTHAIASALRGNLKPGQTLLAATGAPYDTLLPMIGYPEDYQGSLRSFGISYKEVPLDQSQIDIPAVVGAIDESTGVVFVQRSRGYTWRPSFRIDELALLIQAVREVAGPRVTILVDNCYGEMVEELEPTQIGADLCVGSLIKNIGATVVPTGAYVVGTQSAVERSLTAFTAPGLSGHVGPSLGLARVMAQALSMAPQTVAQSLQGLVVASWIFEKAGFETSPRWNEPRTDTIQAVRLGEVKAQRVFCKAVQSFGLVDSRATPVPVVQPGYRDPILMAGGTFIQGSSAELSADGPEREPHVCYLQGGTSRLHVELAALAALEQLETMGLGKNV
jgi:cystathionine beta-lyase family protein involved in aluminum resistance